MVLVAQIRSPSHRRVHRGALLSCAYTCPLGAQTGFKNVETTVFSGTSAPFVTKVLKVSWCPSSRGRHGWGCASSSPEVEAWGAGEPVAGGRVRQGPWGHVEDSLLAADPCPLGAHGRGPEGLWPPRYRAPEGTRGPRGGGEGAPRRHPLRSLPAGGGTRPPGRERLEAGDSSIQSRSSLPESGNTVGTYRECSGRRSRNLLVSKNRTNKNVLKNTHNFPRPHVSDGDADVSAA